MGLNTFDIKQAFRKLEEMMGEVNEDTGEFIYKEEDLAYFVNDLNEKKELKLNNIEDLKREYKARNEALEDKIKSLQSKVKQNDKTIDNLLFLQNVLLDGEKLKTDEYNFFYKSNQSVTVPEKVDDSYKGFIKTTIEWDKTAIKNALQNCTKEEFEEFNKKGFGIQTKSSLNVR
jgi:hypothetical protein